jgi:membrane protein implicated in regulation of membrane protease activity
VINYVRIPVAFSLLLLLAFFPLILGLSEPEYHRASGLTTQPYLWRWLAVTGVLFAASAVIYALRCRRASSRARKQAARARERQMAQTRGRQAAPTAHDVVPSPAAPPPGFDVWHPVRPAPDSPDPHGPA